MAETRPSVDAAEVIDASPIFSGISSPARERLAAVLVPRSFDRDQAVYLRGDEAVAFYGIAEGRVRFSAASPEGKEVVLDYAAAGQWFGEIGLFDDGPRVVDARAAEPSRLLVLARRDLISFCRTEPGLALNFVALFSRRIRVAEDLLTDAAFLTLPARLAKKLLQLAGDADAIRVSQDELGRLTGVTRESAGKQLKQWEREGLVKIDYGRVLLVDQGALRRIVAAATGETA